ncbi:hypothetical protein GUJ93_ZPchr0006g44709 [Zizania palustris]|uniref:Uncharacterized protein n=1 Tax=Zizania palustris TaxID=103762 RepID=A0A8J5T9Y4_ZIZPA|nr:hypothetical protein GUJ93_ZPchr0006g44709 [Zizania palustris]
MGDVSLNRPIKPEPAAGGIAQGNSILDMMSSGWTDERHLLYISSMEASFIEQLHTHEQNGNQNDSNGNGFKVLRGGVWEKHKFERSSACSVTRRRCCLPASPWIKHFRPRDCSSNVAEASVGDHESGIQTIQGRTPLSHGREWEACKGETTLGESTGLQNSHAVHRITEVSDQNFADDEADVEAESSKACKRRKLRSALTRNFQVVPSRKQFASTKAAGRKDAPDAVYVPAVAAGDDVDSPGTMCREFKLEVSLVAALRRQQIAGSGAPSGFASSTLHTCGVAPPSSSTRRPWLRPEGTLM